MATQGKIVGTMTIQDGTVVDSSVSSTTAIDADKLQHLVQGGSGATNFGLDFDATPTAQTKVVYVAGANGATIRGFHCGLYDTGTSTDVDFDLRINGTTALSSVVNITHAASDRAISDGTLTTTALSADDWVTIDLAVTSSTGAQGPYAWAVIEENATT